nr:hypothetical protein [Moraxella sp. CTOTU46711]
MNKFPVTDSIIGLSAENVADLTYSAAIDYQGRRYIAESKYSEQEARFFAINEFLKEYPELTDLVNGKLQEVKHKLIDVGGAAAFHLANDEKYDAPLGSFRNEQLAENIKMKYYNDKL